MNIITLCIQNNLFISDKNNMSLRSKMEFKENKDVIPSKMIENIQNKLLIKNIELRMFNIEQCYFNPHVLSIEGVNQLQSTYSQHWKSKIYTLFRDTFLPHSWILDIWKDPFHDTNESPNTVHIQFVSFRSKMYVKSILTHFFSYQNLSINVYD